MARIVEAIERYRSRALSCGEAAELLGMSERHFRRLRDRYEAQGAEGLIDRRRGRASGRRAAVDQIEWVIEQYRTRYFDFTVKHFHEQLRAEHEFVLGYSWTKRILQKAGLVKRAPQRSAHRKKRARRPLPGMLLFQDGSTHAWLGGRPPLDLIVTLDDATSALLSAFLVAEEGTISSLLGLTETIGRLGLFCALYTDRGSHYFHTPKAGGQVDKTQPTQVGRALEQLGIEHIPSYSPEARGRMERVFGTLQNRLPPELRLAGIASIEAANRFLAESFIAEHNARFAVAAAEPGSAFVPFARRSRRRPVRAGRARGRQRQLRALRGPFVADPAAAAPPPLRQGDGARARLPRWPARDLPRPAPARALPARWSSSRTSSATIKTAAYARSAARPVDLLDNAPPCPHPHRPISSSGHLMCYQTRTFTACALRLAPRPRRLSSVPGRSRSFSTSMARWSRSSASRARSTCPSACAGFWTTSNARPEGLWPWSAAGRSPSSTGCSRRSGSMLQGCMGWSVAISVRK